MHAWRRQAQVASGGHSHGKLLETQLEQQRVLISQLQEEVLGADHARGPTHRC
jgi:hypothetical protein